LKEETGTDVSGTSLLSSCDPGWRREKEGVFAHTGELFSF